MTLLVQRHQIVQKSSDRGLRSTKSQPYFQPAKLTAGEVYLVFISQLMLQQSRIGSVDTKQPLRRRVKLSTSFNIVPLDRDIIEITLTTQGIGRSYTQASLLEYFKKWVADSDIRPEMSPAISTASTGNDVFCWSKFKKEDANRVISWLMNNGATIKNDFRANRGPTHKRLFSD